MNKPENRQSELPESHYKVDRRYRESNYFLMDQLRYSEPVADFRSVRQAILQSTGFNIGRRVFQFASVSNDP